MRSFYTHVLRFRPNREIMLFNRENSANGIMICGINQVNNYLYISDWHSISDPNAVAEHKIDNVISIMDWSPPEEWCEKCHLLNIKTFYYEIDDHPSVNIIPIAEQIHTQIEQMKSQGETVLLHCQAGVSRSATVVLFHLLKLNRLLWGDDWTKYATVSEQVVFLKTKRPIVHPNYGFILQLKQYFAFEDDDEKDGCNQETGDESVQETVLVKEPEEEKSI